MVEPKKKTKMIISRTTINGETKITQHGHCNRSTNFQVLNKTLSCSASIDIGVP